MSAGPLIDLIAGARPNFMKVAPVIAALEARRAQGSMLRYRLVHTGQHYDQAMSGRFFDELGIPSPHLNLEVGSGSPAEQTAAIMVRYERVLREAPCALCVVVGDVTSTMACAIAARKLGIRVAHIEGGLRSGDWSMPEEINRLVTDAITDFFFTTSEYANTNLRREGVGEGRLFFVGNTMIDTLLQHRPRFRPPAIWNAASLRRKGYFVATLHRPANVDSPEKLEALLRELLAGARELPIIFPVHPRTAKTLEQLSLVARNLHVTEPLGYLEFNYLVEHALAVITDSGGITEEATVLGVPCLTLRDSTERPETIALGTNVLVGTDPRNLRPELDRLFAGDWKRGSVPPLWDGAAAARIVDHLVRLLG